MTTRKPSVFINPNFKASTAAHINPNFLITTHIQQPNIHINPAFYGKLKTEVVPVPVTEISSNDVRSSKASVPVETNLAQFIEKSKTKLIRKQSIPLSSTIPKEKILPNRNKLIKIGLRKLISSTAVTKLKTPSAEKHNSRIYSTKYSNAIKKYKIDHRVEFDSLKKNNIINRYVLQNYNNGSPQISKTSIRKKYIKRLLSNSPIITKQNWFPSSISSNKKLELLNINGIMYKSSRNKLQRRLSNNSINTSLNTISSKNGINLASFTSKSVRKDGRIVFVRGNKFILDKNGLKLTKCSSKSDENKINNNVINLKRIDIGGLTYRAKSNNIFVRTDSHLTRSHLSIVKSKSINMLANRLVKSNVPCQIYRKLGKCAALEKGKCPKVHDKSQICICPNFLKGECNIMTCLLSHNVSLSKMPVCKFFLQGLCVREDCPYLHKKLSQNAEICIEFLRGYCYLAEKCNKRHEYVCPNISSRGKCEKVKCSFCLKRVRLELKNKINSISKKEMNLKNEEVKVLENFNGGSNDKWNISRYFIDDRIKDSTTKNMTVMENFSTKLNNEKQFSNAKPRLGKLPSFIPL